MSKYRVIERFGMYGYIFTHTYTHVIQKNEMWPWSKWNDVAYCNSLEEAVEWIKKKRQRKVKPEPKVVWSE
jgi:hypothetical protein